MIEKIEFEPIGIIHSPFKCSEGTPIQSSAAKGAKGSIKIYDRYVEGLRDLDGFSHIILVFYFHLSSWKGLLQKPFMDDSKRGVFAIRSPSRPNPIGISVVRLNNINGNTLYVEGLDILDGTPLLDIKPYVPQMDVYQVERIGWLEGKIEKLGNSFDDGRFTG